jgi:uncharacterized membrane protein
MALALVVVVLLILVVVLVARTFSHGKMLEQIKWDLPNIRRFEDRLTVLERQIAELKNDRAPNESKQVEPKAVGSVQAERPTPTPVVPLAREERRLEPVITPSHVAPERVGEQARPSRTREEWEAFVGGNLLNRIGAFALILSVGFFLKYAIDKEWISESIRVIIGAVAGIICLAGAYRTHLKGLKVFAQGLVGAGLAILYLSIYASFNFYSLVPQWVAFMLMSVVTALALAQAFHYDSLAVALLGWAGGFLTPIMLSTGHPNEIGFFTYLALLNVGLLATLVKKGSWSILEPLTLAATWILYYAWYVEYYRTDDLLITVFFVLVFCLMFYALAVFRIIRGQAETPVLHHIVTVVNGALLFGSLYALINKDHHEWMGAVTIAIGAIYFATFLLAQRRTQLTTITQAIYLLISGTFLAAATAIQFYDCTTVIFWSLEAVIVLWCALRWRLLYVLQFALGLLLVATLKLFATEGVIEFAPIRDFTLLANLRSLTLAVLSASVGFGAWLMGRSTDVQKEDALESMRDVLHFAWCAFLFILLTVETSDYFRWRMLDASLRAQESLPFAGLMTLSIVWAVYSVPLVWLGLRRSLLTVMIAGIGMLSLGVICVSLRGLGFEPIADFTPVLNLRFGAMLSVMVLLTVHTRLVRDRREVWEWLPQMLTVLQVTGVILLLLLLTAETRDFFEKQIVSLSGTSEVSGTSDTIDRLRNLQQLSLSGVWLLYSVCLMAFGIWRSLRSLRTVAFVLFGITILKIFGYDLSFLETLYRIFSFLGLGLILLAVSYAYQRYRVIIFGTADNKSSV